MRSEMRNGCLVYGQPLRAESAPDAKPRVRATFYFECPGCGETHRIDYPHWEWNGSLTFPTFYPSFKMDRENFCCHFFISDGKIQFVSDSTHKLSGQTVKLPEVAERG